MYFCYSNCVLYVRMLYICYVYGALCLTLKEDTTDKKHKEKQKKSQLKYETCYQK